MSSRPPEETSSAKTPLSWEDVARLDWLSKPRLDPEIFEEYRKVAHAASLDDDRPPAPDRTEPVLRRRAEMLTEIERIKTIVGGDQRFHQLSELVLAFRERPSIERYSLIRMRFPELDIKVALSGGVSAALAIEKQCEEFGIRPCLLGGALDGSEPDIDELCLILIDHLVARDNLKGPGAMQRRRAAISDAMVNYLIAFMLEGAHWAAEIQVPPSLTLLIRHQLGALRGDLYAQYEAGEMKLNVAQFAGQRLGPQERLSINRLLELSRQIPNCSISRSTAARWLKDEEFQSHLKWSRDTKARLSLTKTSLTKNNVRDTP